MATPTPGTQCHSEPLSRWMVEVLRGYEESRKAGDQVRALCLLQRLLDAQDMEDAASSSVDALKAWTWRQVHRHSEGLIRQILESASSSGRLTVSGTCPAPDAQMSQRVFETIVERLTGRIAEDRRWDEVETPPEAQPSAKMHVSFSPYIEEISFGGDGAVVHESRMRATNGASHRDASQEAAPPRDVGVPYEQRPPPNEFRSALAQYQKNEQDVTRGPAGTDSSPHAHPALSHQNGTGAAGSNACDTTTPRRRRAPFKSPWRTTSNDGSTWSQESNASREAPPAASHGDVSTTSPEAAQAFKNVDPDIADRILKEILDTNLNVRWADLSGLESVKDLLHEMIILPSLYPETFRGLRRPPRGLLLFGPPGNGKTMIAKAIATEANLTFFSISASVLCSKWLGEGERTMRALFTIARAKAPAFIFFDEIDAILCARSTDENESTRRLKNEFLLQCDGTTSSSDDGVIIMGATNRPFDIDEAARRRLPKRIYVPLPGHETRKALLVNLLKAENHDLSVAQIEDVAQMLEGYSCSDVVQVSQHAAMEPVRDAMRDGTLGTHLRAIQHADFVRSMAENKPSVDRAQCATYDEFAEKFGTGQSRRV